VGTGLHSTRVSRTSWSEAPPIPSAFPGIKDPVQWFALESGGSRRTQTARGLGDAPLLRNKLLRPPVVPKSGRLSKQDEEMTCCVSLVSRE
jgi:hypothetical protein